MIKKKYELHAAKHGFTLIELLVTFSIVAIISGIGFASFVSYSRKQAVLQAAANLKQMVDLARYNAVSVIKPAACASTDEVAAYTFSFCLNGNPSCTIGTNAAYEVHVNCHTSPPLIASGTLPQNVTFSISGVTGTPCQDLQFNSVRPSVAGAPCSIFLNGYNNNVKINIDPLGYVSY